MKKRTFSVIINKIACRKQKAVPAAGREEIIMPINIPASLPANSLLQRENIFVMEEERASHQDIRPLKIAILNLMPKKIETETQLLRLLSNSPLQIDLELLQTASHVSKNTSEKHLFKFYKTIDDVRQERFDGLIITGAPVEQMLLHR